MPIKFLCPRCQAVIKAPSKRAGDKVDCPNCQQRLQIPYPPTSKTILASIVTAPEASPPQGIPAPYPLVLPNYRTPPKAKSWLKRIALMAATVMVSLLVFTTTCTLVGSRTNKSQDAQAIGTEKNGSFTSTGSLLMTILAVGQQDSRGDPKMVALLSLENTSETRKVDFLDFLDPEITSYLLKRALVGKTQEERQKLGLELVQDLKQMAKITDEHGNNYDVSGDIFGRQYFRLDPTRGFTLGTVTARSLGPKEKVYFDLSAPKPIEKATHLNFAVPLLTKTGSMSFSFSINIKRGGESVSWPGALGVAQVQSADPLYVREGAREEIGRINAAMTKQQKLLPAPETTLLKFKVK